MAMKSTPINYSYNPELLATIPAEATRVVEVGCSGGGLAKMFRETNPQCEYIGIDVDPEYAEVSRKWCSKVLVGNIEKMDEEIFGSLFPSDCWVFGDVLEHLYDPWALLKRIRSRLRDGASVVSCIPNAQHWSLQVQLNLGYFRYENLGLMDRTHIRWFTKKSIAEMFQSTGYRIVYGTGRIAEEPLRAEGMVGIRALAKALGADPDVAENDATPIQWVVRAVAC
jgi:2-polyprenyl-3-methyl-5-hydroxy-6-metoxy-1,4-benzoquinol methylase